MFLLRHHRGPSANPLAKLRVQVLPMLLMVVALLPSWMTNSMASAQAPRRKIEPFTVAVGKFATEPSTTDALQIRNLVELGMASYLQQYQWEFGGQFDFLGLTKITSDYNTQVQEAAVTFGGGLVYFTDDTPDFAVPVDDAFMDIVYQSVIDNQRILDELRTEFAFVTYFRLQRHDTAAPTLAPSLSPTTTQNPSQSPTMATLTPTGNTNTDGSADSDDEQTTDPDGIDRSPNAVPSDDEPSLMPIVLISVGAVVLLFVVVSMYLFRRKHRAAQVDSASLDGKGAARTSRISKNELDVTQCDESSPISNRKTSPSSSGDHSSHSHTSIKSMKSNDSNDQHASDTMKLAAIGSTDVENNFGGFNDTDESDDDDADADDFHRPANAGEGNNSSEHHEQHNSSHSYPSLSRMLDASNWFSSSKPDSPVKVNTVPDAQPAGDVEANRASLPQQSSDNRNDYSLDTSTSFSESLFSEPSLIGVKSIESFEENRRNVHLRKDMLTTPRGPSDSLRYWQPQIDKSNKCALAPTDVSAATLAIADREDHDDEERHATAPGGISNAPIPQIRFDRGHMLHDYARQTKQHSSSETDTFGANEEDLWDPDDASLGTSGGADMEVRNLNRDEQSMLNSAVRNQSYKMQQLRSPENNARGGGGHVEGFRRNQGFDFDASF